MGRPVNSRFIGPENSAFDQVIAYARPQGGVVERVKVVRQRSNNSYEVQFSDESRAVARLVDPGVNTNVIHIDDIEPGEMFMGVAENPSDPDDTLQFVSNLNNRTVKTFQGNVYGWPSPFNFVEFTIGGGSDSLPTPIIGGDSAPR